MILIDKLKQLRKETSISMSDCEKALKETNGDIDKAKEILRKWGKEVSLKRVSRETKQGMVDIYLHPNKKVGVMLQIHCETDFVAKSEEFKKLAHEISLQIAAMHPMFLKEEEIPAEFLDGEKKIYQEQFKNSGKPQKIVDQIIEGKLKKYKEEVSLLSQVWIKDENKTIKDLIDESIAKIGENMAIKKFVRYEI
ncbi:MAG: elongation factor Ts [Candidatus Nealsonbacteria bacterium]|nr:elongation factor Ts [Candidatus Nealsonbacteria bacterium]